MTDKVESRVERAKKAKWYVVHTYSGYEKKVKANIEKLVENRGNIDDIFEVAVPTEEYIDTKGGKKKLKERKLFPGYVLVKMIMNDVSWYLVRNTRGVTGFVGPGSKPVPLSDEEVKALGVQDTSLPSIDLKEKDIIKVTTGPFENFMGTVESINLEKKKVKVFVSMFGRETLVELDFDQVEKI
ncbi:transcription termination/antitermination protein NusG [Tepidimicrobium xylanilyticum]|uniref:Transcription termination/antitermination protein NusG n=1 Tax=Tepidimicrobium xylanilyticum TaxID=1123352 RepID=A0A1H3EVL2_9FIRM|nr:transcription termination/antitermination protein NusG [Tepidimicrobium xylanilyticum]GMG98133.1 transcription termination/antitermination protein NusG [Tepidimicrobium xylanilyticum]SDX81964.1 transcription antitermination protein nusG [Tepidimicrobium xylanilyticum]